MASLQGSGDGSATAASTAPERDQLLGRGQLGRQPAVGPGAADHALRSAASAARRGRPPGSSGARSSMAAGGADQFDGQDPRAGWRRRGAACGRRAQPIDTWSSCMAEVGSESTLAGAASRLFSATMAAAVYWAIIRPEFTPASSARNGRQAVRAVGGRACGRCDARPWRRRRPAAMARKSADVAERARRGSCRRTRPGRRAARSGCRWPTSSSRRRRASAWATVSRAAPCTWGVQRSE